MRNLEFRVTPATLNLVDVDDSTSVVASARLPNDGPAVIVQIPGVAYADDVLRTVERLLRNHAKLELVEQLGSDLLLRTIQLDFDNASEAFVSAQKNTVGSADDIFSRIELAYRDYKHARELRRVANDLFNKETPKGGENRGVS